eukprot:TRINITY_DN7860_c0_g1_i1.p1 TRINITY_DN7860_c0_g1~~TRINITY_DN7860_c0_g1_i1.p1  ORF type:complete len:352 (+),score=58.00 TRINITY_DN7860_c0_g1_i1:76-1131(+)
MKKSRCLLTGQFSYGGLDVSEIQGGFEEIRPVLPKLPPWKDKFAKDFHGRWSINPKLSYALPRGVPSRGIEYRKFYGEVQYTKPFYQGGIYEAIHDENRNKMNYKEWDFPSLQNMSQIKHARAHIRGMRWPTYEGKYYSKAALKTIAENAFELSRRKKIVNPYFPGQSIEGAAEMTSHEMEVYRRQAFLAGIEFPEFPDVQPVEQVDPWEASEESRVPEIDNDHLLNSEMWQTINENMKGMAKKIQTFKDTERKKIWTWKMALLMQQIKRARQEEAFNQKLKIKVNQKARLDEKARDLKPWERLKREQERLKAEEDVTEETEAEIVTRESRKVIRRSKQKAGHFKPPGTKL